MRTIWLVTSYVSRAEAASSFLSVFFGVRAGAGHVMRMRGERFGVVNLLSTTSSISACGNRWPESDCMCSSAGGGVVGWKDGLPLNVTAGGDSHEAQTWATERLGGLYSTRNRSSPSCAHPAYRRDGAVGVVGAER